MDKVIDLWQAIASALIMMVGAKVVQLLQVLEVMFGAGCELVPPPPPADYYRRHDLSDDPFIREEEWIAAGGEETFTEFCSARALPAPPRGGSGIIRLRCGTDSTGAR